MQVDEIFEIPCGWYVQYDFKDALSARNEEERLAKSVIGGGHLIVNRWTQEVADINFWYLGDREASIRAFILSTVQKTVTINSKEA